MDKAVQTQLANIEKRTGKSLAELTAIVKASGLQKHGELRDMLKRDLAMGHGDANTLVHVVLQSDGASAAEAAGKTTGDVVDDLYTGPKAALRPLHARLVEAIDRFGPYEVAPKKGYVSLRRRRQFAMIGPATMTQIEIGLNAKELPADPRLKPQPPGGMCAYKLRLSAAQEVDTALVGWLRAAYDASG